MSDEKNNVTHDIKQRVTWEFKSYLCYAKSKMSAC